MPSILPKTPRIGLGYDIHQLVTNRPLCIGGVHIPYHKGAIGHSDADVLLHALCDALLGALNLGDIGTHFPNTDPQYKNIDSAILVRKVYEKIQHHRYEIINIDAVVHLEAPQIKPHVPAIQQRIADLLALSPSVVSIKATTHEQLGAIGRNEGIAAQVIALLVSL